ncbi:MAG: T3SS effector HopA1 family protein [Leptolyngbyaceae cyanobacterium MO_188.B28]|nr:T3SS effector HopA1 family protein [Leptolyngbyaceae cyanobacterium MO_188.B28]
MQLLDTLQSQRFDAFAARLLDALEDIVHNVQIASNFGIHHPNYRSMELRAARADCLQQLPMDLQNQYLSLQLQSFLYAIYYNGSYRPSSVPETDAVSSSPSKPIENNTVKGLNLKFYEALHDSNQGEGYFDPGWLVLRQERDGSLAVQKEGLTLHIKYASDTHGKEACYSNLTGRSAVVGDKVAIRLPRNRVETGFYIAVGNAGPVKADTSGNPPDAVNLYFNVTPEGAIALMRSLTQRLNAIPIPFTFKVLDDPDHYRGYDTSALNFEKLHYERIRPILQTIYTEYQSHFGEETPLFTKRLAPGLALSEEPDHKFSAREDFGLNRCQIVANGLVEAWRAGHTSPEARMNAILKHFSSNGVKMTCPYMNANSEDIYTPLFYQRQPRP